MIFFKKLIDILTIKSVSFTTAILNITCIVFGVMYTVLAASLAFGGLYLGVWIILLLMIRDENQKNRVIVPSILTFGVIIGVIVSQTIRISLGLPSKIPGNPFLSSSAWEWMLMIFIFIAILILIYTTDPIHVKK